MCDDTRSLTTTSGGSDGCHYGSGTERLQDAGATPSDKLKFGAASYYRVYARCSH